MVGVLDVVLVAGLEGHIGYGVHAELAAEAVLRGSGRVDGVAVVLGDNEPGLVVYHKVHIGTRRDVVCEDADIAKRDVGGRDELDADIGCAGRKGIYPFSHTTYCARSATEVTVAPAGMAYTFLMCSRSFTVPPGGRNLMSSTSWFGFGS